MTNEEKAREMAEEYRAVLAANTDFDVNDLDLAEEDATRLTLDMAEWKDHQFKEYLEQKKEKYVTALSIALQKSETQDAVVYDKVQSVLTEIINKHFKED